MKAQSKAPKSDEATRRKKPTGGGVSKEVRRELLELMRRDDAEELRDFLEDHPNVVKQLSSVTDDDGYSLLALSIPGGSLETTATLLDLEKNLQTLSNCLLHAIDIKAADKVVMILERQKQLGFKFPIELPCMSPSHGYWKGICDEFPPYETPLMLACDLNSPELVKILLEYGHRLYIPHPFTCSCSICRTSTHPSLMEAKARYREYKALVSPVYMIQTSFDPVLTAFRMNTELQAEAFNEPEMHDEYKALAEQCIKFATALLGLCRTREEVLTLLSRGSELSSKRKFQPFNRVQQALQLDFKTFVSHVNCQQVLSKEWYGGDNTFRDLTTTAAFFHFLWRIVTLPLLGIYLWIFPFVERGNHERSHATMFHDQAASFVIFLLANMARQIFDEEGPARAPPSGILSYYVIIHVTGSWYDLTRLLFRKGNGAFLQDPWNIYDLLMLTFYNLTFVCWTATAYEILADPDSMDIPRQFWPAYEPKLVGEILYSFCILLTFFRSFKYLQLNRTIGPLQLCIRRMIISAVPFLTIMSIAWMAFSVTMSNLYSHYSGNKAVLPDGTVIEQSNAYRNIMSATYSIYWSFFGFTDLDVPRVVLPPIDVKVGESTAKIYHKHTLTEMMGILIFGTFHLIGIVVLMNIMIAIMTETYSNIVAKSMIEWKVSRTKIWISFLYSGCRNPIPFNLLPSVNTCVDLYRCIRGVSGKKKKGELGFFFYSEDFKTIGDDDVTYERLMTELTKRFIKAGGTIEAAMAVESK